MLYLLQKEMCAHIEFNINGDFFRLYRFTKLFLVVGCLMLTMGCQTANKMAEYSDMSKPELQAEVSEKIKEAEEKIKPNFIIRAGDSITSSFQRLTQITGTIYIINKDDDETLNVELSAQSQPITGWEDMELYLEVLGYTAKLTPLGEKSKDDEEEVKADYMKVSVHKTDTLTKVQAAKCKTKLSGALPLGAIVSDICKSAKVVCKYGDTGASAYTGVVYPMAFEGNCSDALDYIGQKANLAVKFSDKDIEFKMMETATIDLGIPLRDRKIALDIIAATSSLSDDDSSSSSSNDSSSASSIGSGKELQSGYQTNYFRSIRAVMESMRTSFGTWNYLPETGQIFIRDRAETVASIKTTLNRMAQAFQSRFNVTLTLYRINVNDGIHVSSNLIRTLNDRISFSLGVAGMIDDPQGTITYGKNGTDGVITALSELGNVETIDNYTMTLQAGIPQTLKVATNTEYVQSISTTTTGTSGTVSSSVEQSNATDGSFLTMQARQAESGKISVDYGVFINQLEGFDETTTDTTTVKSQRGYERTFDTTSVVEDGVPYVATMISSRKRSDTVSSIPGLDKLGFIGALFGGDKEDSMNSSYIAVVIEAVRQ